MSGPGRRRISGWGSLRLAIRGSLGSRLVANPLLLPFRPRSQCQHHHHHYHQHQHHHRYRQQRERDHLPHTSCTPFARRPRPLVVDSTWGNFSTEKTRIESESRAGGGVLVCSLEDFADAQRAVAVAEISHGWGESGVPRQGQASVGRFHLAGGRRSEVISNS